MTHVPVEASEIERFTPPALANIENPPVFRLSAGTRRDLLLYNRRREEEDAQSYGVDDIRAEVLRGLREGWTEEGYAKYEPLLKEYWAASDDHGKAMLKLPEDQQTPFVPPNAELTEADMDEISDQISNFWKPLRKMTAQNRTAGQITPAILCSVIIAGWKNLDVPFERQGGKISVETTFAVQEALRGLEVQHLGDNAPPRAFGELYAACVRRLYLPEEVAKNSASPSMSDTTQAPSSNGTESSNGTSTANSTEPTPQA